jgi:hypothetical protein
VFDLRIRSVVRSIDVDDVEEPARAASVPVTTLGT